MPKARVVDLERELAAGAAIAPGPHIAPEHTVIYEAHVKGLTRLHPGVPEHLRGTYAGAGECGHAGALPAAGHHHLCLLPVQHHIDEKHLLDLGLANYWGYNTLGLLRARTGLRRRAATAVRPCATNSAPWSTSCTATASRWCSTWSTTTRRKAAPTGPTLSWRGLDNASTYALDGAGQYLNFTGCGNALNMPASRGWCSS